MEKKAVFSKILTVVGTILVWFPLLAPVVLGFVSLGMDGIYRLDYLMPAELGVLVFVGGALLLWGAIRTRSRRGIIAWGFGLAAGSIAILISFGDVVPGGVGMGHCDRAAGHVHTRNRNYGDRRDFVVEGCLGTLHLANYETTPAILLFLQG